MRINETLKKAAGLIFEIEDPAPKMASAPQQEAPRIQKSAEQILKDTEGPELSEVKAPAPENVQPIRPDGTVDFDAIYRMAQIPTSPFGADQVLEILKSLPADLPIESRRATVRVTLQAMQATSGISAEGVVADTTRKLASLASYLESFSGQVDEFQTRTAGEIARLTAEIARIQESSTQAVAKRELLVAACEAESDRLDDVLEFFSLDTGTSKFATPT